MHSCVFFILIAVFFLQPVTSASCSPVPESRSGVDVVSYGNSPCGLATEIEQEEILQVEVESIREQHNKSIYITKWKRRLDQTMVLALSLPALAASSIVAVSIWTVDGQPVLFYQKRAGKDGKPFWIVKFRTIRDGEGPTRLGMWLRRTRLDEVPQLWNIWKGEMSFIGPRPLEYEMAEKLKEEHPDFRFREVVLPGLAGLAQAEGATYAAQTTCQAILFDKRYVCDLSFLRDLKVLSKGIGALFLGKCPP